MLFKKLCFLFISVIFIKQVMAKENDIKEYGIVILPEEKCAKIAGKLNNEIAKLLPHLVNQNNYWHVTLYHGAYKAKDLNEIYDKIIALKPPAFDLKFTKIYSTADRWIDWGIEKTEPLDNLHKSVVQAISPYHQRPLKRSRDVYKDAKDDQRAQIGQYGVSGVLELYNPHLTLFYQYPADDKLRAAAENISHNYQKDMVCKASKIVLGELGYNGNVVEIIYAIDFINN